MKNKIICMIFTLAMCLSMLMTGTMAAGDVAQVEFSGSVTSYAAIEEAWEAAQDLQGNEETPVTVRLLANAEIDAPLRVNSGRYIAFDGGSYTLSGPSGGIAIQVENAGALTVQRGTISVSGNECTGIRSNGGSITIKGGNIIAGVSSGEDDTVWRSTGYCVYNDGGTIIIEGGNITATISGGDDEMPGMREAIGYCVYNNSGTVVMRNGTISIVSISGEMHMEMGGGYGIYNTNGTVTVNGGNIIASGGRSNYGIYSNGNGSNLTVSGGSLEISSRDSYGVYTQGGTASIDGVNINVIGAYDAGVEVGGGTVEILGGSITGSGMETVGVGAYGGLVIVSGGTVRTTGDPSYGARVYGGSITVRGGELSGGSRGIYVQGGSGGSNALIEGGTVAGGKYGIEIFSGRMDVPSTVNITNGSVTGGEYGVYVWDSSGAPTANVSGGSITGGDVGIYYGKIYNSKITGGTFAGGSSAVQLDNGGTIGDVLGDGFSFWQGGTEMDDTDRSNTSVPGSASALRSGSVATVTIDGNAAGYTTISEAWNAARAAGRTATVTLLSDVSTEISLQVTDGSDITFEGDRYSLSGAPVGGIIHVSGGTLRIKSGTISAAEDASIGLNVTGGGVSLSGGVFAGTGNAKRISSQVAAGDLLATGYGYQTAGGWLDGEALEALEITEDVTVLARSLTVTVKADPAQGGTVSGGGSHPYKGTVTVTAHANSGYRFVKWVKDGETAGTGASYSFVLTEDTVLTAVFERTVPASGGSSGSGSSDDGSSGSGSSDDGSSGGGSSDDGSSGGGSSAPSTYPPAVSGSDHGNVSTSPSNPKRGDTVTVTPTPDEGYEVGDVIVKDSRGNVLEVENNGDGTYRFAQPASRVTIEVTFVPQKDGTNSPSSAFSDLDANAWYHEAVDYVIGNGLMNGYGNGTFGPNDILSRAMLAQALYNQMGRPGTSGNDPFTDVSSNAWYTDAVTWAAVNGIISGYGNEIFGPDDPITREQLAVMLYRFAQSQGNGLTGEWRQLDYSDMEEISEYAFEAVVWCTMNDILGGYDNNTLQPKGNATRAEAAVMLMRFVSRVDIESFTITR